MTAAAPNWTHLQFDRLTMWPTVTPGALQFFAMVAQTPDYQLKTMSTLLRGHSEVIHPKTWCTLFKTRTEKFTTWGFLSLPARKGSLTIATNHKRGSMSALIKLFSTHLEKHYDVGTQTRQTHSFCLWYTHCMSYQRQLAAIIQSREPRYSYSVASVSFFNTKHFFFKTFLITQHRCLWGLVHIMCIILLPRT